MFLAALYHHIDLSSSSRTGTRGKRERTSPVRDVIFFDLVPAATLYFLPPNSIAALLRPCSKVLRQWPKLLSSTSSLSRLPNWLTGEAGPYGYGCGKFCEVVCAYILLSFRYQPDTKALASIPQAFELGPIPGRNALLLVVVLSLGVNLVLSLWSKMTQSKGNHEGVEAMVKNSIGRQIGISEHMKLACFAFGNSICEELISRGFFYFEFVQSAKMSSNAANIAQAVAFGIWHYNGIPSGFTGVGLTFVYGLMMGALREYGGGLLLPILAHTVADYFIFSVVVRKW